MQSTTDICDQQSVYRSGTGHIIPARYCREAYTQFVPRHLPGRPPAHQTTYDDNRRPVG